MKTFVMRLCNQNGRVSADCAVLRERLERPRGVLVMSMVSKFGTASP